MINYTDSSGTSGITAYQFNDDAITITFKSGSTYRYGVETLGTATLGEMVTLAQSGQGLNRFINQRLVRNSAVKVQ